MPLRITMVTARYYPYLGGIETHVREIGKRIIARGHRVYVITTDPSGNLPECEVIDGITIKRIKAWPKNRDYYFVSSLSKEITEADTDIIHFQGWHTH